VEILSFTNRCSSMGEREYKTVEKEAKGGERRWPHARERSISHQHLLDS
jgi:hypothetical protein